MSFIFQEIPAESLRNNIRIITGDNSVLMSAGNRKLSGTAVASCRYASELTFKPIAVCFVRPQRNVIRFIEKNDCFTLSYFPPQHRHILESFGPGAGGKFTPCFTSAGNIYYPQSELVFECRRVYSLELILSREIQAIVASEKKRSIYPGGEVPRMFAGEIVNGWHKVAGIPAGVDAARLLPEAGSNRFLTSGEK
jgi:hypothetical protein